MTNWWWNSKILFLSQLQLWTHFCKFTVFVFYPKLWFQFCLAIVCAQVRLAWSILSLNFGALIIQQARRPPPSACPPNHRNLIITFHRDHSGLLHVKVTIHLMPHHDDHHLVPTNYHYAQMTHHLHSYLKQVLGFHWLKEGVQFQAQIQFYGSRMTSWNLEFLWD